MIENIPNGFEEFYDIMINYLKENKDKYDTFIKKYYKYDSTEMKSGIYSLYIGNYNIKVLHTKLSAIIDKK